MTLPFIVDAADRLAWIDDHADELAALLGVHGAIVFRGSARAEIGRFEQLAQRLGGDLDDGYGDLPREAEGRRIYKATPFPSHLPIRLHNEAAHTRSWPARIMFYCVTPARDGGASLLADGRVVLRRLPGELVAEIVERGLCYVRNFIPGLDVAWQAFFRTDDRAKVSRWLSEHGVAHEWSGSGLHTRWPAAAVARHPHAGDATWFNQIQLHHLACLPQGARRAIERVYGAADAPRNVTYGDGTPIDDATIATIVSAMTEATVEVSLRADDLLLVDNLLVSHGRAPYAGERRIAVAMGAMMRGER